MPVSGHAQAITSFRRVAILVIVIALGRLLLLTLLRHDPLLRTSLDDAVFVIANALAAGGLLYGARRSAPYGRPVNLAWAVLAVAQLFSVLSDLVWGVIEVGIQARPFPSLSHALYLLYCILFTVGLLLLPGATLTRSNRLKMLLDIGITLIAAILVSLALIVTPALSSSATEALAIAFSMAFTILDFVLLFAVLELLFSQLGTSGRGPLLLLAASSLAKIGGDVTFASQSMQINDLSTCLAGSFWIANYTLVGLAGILQATTRPPEASPSPLNLERRYSQSIWAFYLPYLWVGIICVLLLWNHYHPIAFPPDSLEWGTVMAFILVLARQALVVHENRSLYTAAQHEIAERQRTEEILRKREEEVKKLNAQLEAWVTERTAQLEAAIQKLGDEITERIKIEDQLRGSLREKEVLLKEIHHRVKNNLQVVSSLLNLQSQQVQDLPSAELLRDSQNRIKTMALVHEKLYQAPDLARIDFAQYVRNLTLFLFRSYRVDPDAVTLQVNAPQDIYLSIDTAIPCGLIVNELVSNALKYAFPPDKYGLPARDSTATEIDPGRPRGEIRIDLSHETNGRLALVVRDNGIGLPDTIDLYHTESLGLQLVVTLVEQLQGSITLDRCGGTTFKIAFVEPGRQPTSQEISR